MNSLLMKVNQLTLQFLRLALFICNCIMHLVQKHVYKAPRWAGVIPKYCILH